MKFVLLVFLIIICCPINAADDTTLPQSESLSITHHRSLPQDRPDIFDVDIEKLPNGLGIIKKYRPDAKNVVLLLAVDVGMRDFACGKNQIAHVLEHTLFTGTTKYTEAELRGRIKEFAGELNGYTFNQITYYYIDIHAAHIDRAMESLYAMMTDTIFNETKIQHAIKAVHAELGTSDDMLRRTINDDLPVFEQALARLYPATSMGCMDPVNPTDISLEEVRQGFEKFYHASNMRLLIVGDFNHQQVQTLLQNTFARLPVKPPRDAYQLELGTIDYEPIVSHQRMLSVEAELGFTLRVVGREHPDAVAIRFLSEYLDDGLYTLLRDENGLGYTPEVEYRSENNIGYLLAHSKTTYQWIDQAQVKMQEFYQNIEKNGLSQADFDRIKQKRILELESKQFTNLKLAEDLVFYSKSIVEKGYMRNTLAEYRTLSRDYVNAALHKYFPPQPVYAQLRPHTKTSSLWLIVKFVFAGLVLAVPLQRILKWMRSARQ